MEGCSGLGRGPIFGRGALEAVDLCSAAAPPPRTASPLPSAAIRRQPPRATKRHLGMRRTSTAPPGPADQGGDDEGYASSAKPSRQVRTCTLSGHTEMARSDCICLVPTAEHSNSNAACCQRSRRAAPSVLSPGPGQRAAAAVCRVPKPRSWAWLRAAGRSSGADRGAGPKEGIPFHNGARRGPAAHAPMRVSRISRGLPFALLVRDFDHERIASDLSVRRIAVRPRFGGCGSGCVAAAWANVRTPR